MHEVALDWCARPIASTMGPWHFRHASSAIRRLWGLIPMGSGNEPVVKASECQKPFDALLAYLATMPGGVWQSLQLATTWWLDFAQPSYCSCMTWQFAQAAASFDRYEAP